MQKGKKTLKICSKCISDETVPGISFDVNEICNYCKMHNKLEAEYPTGENGRKKIAKIVERIKFAGRKKKYDCIVGVSGGCDSSFLIYKVKEFGLRPLAVHFDNTWNSEIATLNIHRVLKKLNIDLFTYVVNNEEYDDILRSFLKASVKDIECPTDIGLITALYMAAEKFRIKYILDGHSFKTEGIVPIDLMYMDGKYIESVHKKHGSCKMKTYPNLWLSRWLKWLIIKKIKRVRPLYYIDYQKEVAKQFLIREFNWQWYGGKHGENRYTTFFIYYYLPNKFNINFSLLEYSGLIRSGQISREEALKKIQELKQLDTRETVQLVKKRLGFTEEEFDKIMKLPIKTYRHYKTYKPIFEHYKWFFWLLYKMNLVPHSFYIKYTKKINSI